MFLILVIIPLRVEAQCMIDDLDVPMKHFRTNMRVICELHEKDHANGLYLLTIRSILDTKMTAFVEGNKATTHIVLDLDREGLITLPTFLRCSM